MMERFAESTARIQTNIEKISNSTDALSHAVEEAADGVSKTAERSVEMYNNMTSIDEEALSSRQISGELQSEVGKFKLE